MDKQKSAEVVSSMDGNFSKDKEGHRSIENGVQYNQGDIEDHLVKEDIKRKWDERDGDQSEVIDTEGHRNRINHY